MYRRLHLTRRESRNLSFRRVPLFNGSPSYLRGPREGKRPTKMKDSAMGNPEIEIVSAKIVSQSASGVPTWEVASSIGGTPAAATVIRWAESGALSPLELNYTLKKTSPCRTSASISLI
jgi:hypothetical protein